FTRDAAFGSLDVALELFEVAVVVFTCGHRAHPDEDGCGAGIPMPGMPRPTPVRGLRPAACASPALVRRWLCGPPSAIRWCGAAPVTVAVTMSPGRMSRPAGSKCTNRPSRARPDMR